MKIPKSLTQTVMLFVSLVLFSPCGSCPSIEQLHMYNDIDNTILARKSPSGPIILDSSFQTPCISPCMYNSVQSMYIHKHSN